MKKSIIIEMNYEDSVVLSKKDLLEFLEGTRTEGIEIKIETLDDKIIISEY